MKIHRWVIHDLNTITYYSDNNNIGWAKITRIGRDAKLIMFDTEKELRSFVKRSNFNRDKYRTIVPVKITIDIDLSSKSLTKQILKGQL